MNWKRGLLRVWIALSIVWVISVFAMNWKNIAEANSAYLEDLQEAQSVLETAEQRHNGDLTSAARNRVLMRFQLADRRQALRNELVRETTSMALIPPLIVIVLNFIVGWIASGFRRQ